METVDLQTHGVVEYDASLSRAADSKVGDSVDILII
jgi:hypothetical protein